MARSSAGPSASSAKQLGAADTSYAHLPGEILPLEEQTNVLVATQNADKLLVTMLLGCVFAALTIASTTDAGLLGNDTSTKLPIIGTEIQIVGFYVVAPLILLGFYLYFHLYLQFVWDGLAALPAIFPDGTPLYRKGYPWLLSRPSPPLLAPPKHGQNPPDRADGEAVFRRCLGSGAADARSLLVEVSHPP